MKVDLHSQKVLSIFSPNVDPTCPLVSFLENNVYLLPAGIRDVLVIYPRRYLLIDRKGQSWWHHQGPASRTWRRWLAPITKELGAGPGTLWRSTRAQQDKVLGLPLEYRSGLEIGDSPPLNKKKNH